MRHAAGLARARIAFPAEYPRPPAAHGLDQDLEDCLLELAHALADANDAAANGAGAHRGHHAHAAARRPLDAIERILDGRFWKSMEHAPPD